MPGSGAVCVCDMLIFKEDPTKKSGTLTVQTVQGCIDVDVPAESSGKSSRRSLESRYCVPDRQSELQALCTVLKTSENRLANGNRCKSVGLFEHFGFRARDSKCRIARRTFRQPDQFEECCRTLLLRISKISRYSSKPIPAWGTLLNWPPAKAAERMNGPWMDKRCR